MLAGSCSKHVTFSQLLTNKCLNELAHFWGRGCGTVGRVTTEDPGVVVAQLAELLLPTYTRGPELESSCHQYL